MFNLILSSQLGSTADNAHILDINVVINWQLSYRVSSDQYHLSLSQAQVSTHRNLVFFEVIRWQVTSFQMIAGLSLFFKKSIWNMSCLCAAQLRFWFQTDLGRENSASYYRQGRQLLLTLLTMVTRWSRSTSNFYALIGQNFTDEFMRKIYTASWILFTFVSTCAVFNSLFPLDVQDEIQLLSGVFCYSWLVGFGWEIRLL